MHPLNAVRSSGPRRRVVTIFVLTIAAAVGAFVVGLKVVGPSINHRRSPTYAVIQTTPTPAGQPSAFVPDLRPIATPRSQPTKTRVHNRTVRESQIPATPHTAPPEEDPSVAACPTVIEPHTQATYKVRVAVYTDTAAASRAAKTLRQAGLFPELETTTDAGGPTAVNLGPYTEMPHAKRQAAKARSLGFMPRIIAQN